MAGSGFYWVLPGFRGILMMGCFRYSIFPVENDEMVFGRWEDDVIWDCERMDVVPQPKILTLDANDENVILGIPDDIDPATKQAYVQQPVKVLRFRLTLAANGRMCNGMECRVIAGQDSAPARAQVETAAGQGRRHQRAGGRLAAAAVRKQRKGPVQHQQRRVLRGQGHRGRYQRCRRPSTVLVFFSVWTDWNFWTLVRSS